MCMMLYLATRTDVPLRSSKELRIEDPNPAADPVRRGFSLPCVHFVGAHTGCSCGFPSVSAAVPIEYFPGMLDDHPERDADLGSVEALLALIAELISRDTEVQLYPVWNGEEAEPPKGTIEMAVDELSAERFFFNERFFYRITRGAV